MTPDNRAKLEAFLNGDFHVGIDDLVTHFKRDIYRATHKDCGEYWYKILAISEETESKQLFVIYKALYTNEEMGVKYGDVYARPFNMFLSLVDKQKYPEAKQKYRFEIGF